MKDKDKYNFPDADGIYNVEIVISACVWWQALNNLRPLGIARKSYEERRHAKAGHHAHCILKTLHHVARATCGLGLGLELRLARALA